MKWYTKYLQVYDKSLSQISPSVVKEINNKLQELKDSNATPVVSIILIAYNEEKHLASCLWSLVENQYNFPVEILAVNNNSTDLTEKTLQQLGVTYFNETKKGPGHARQCGLNHARGKYHICIDADTMYPPHYVETHLKELMKPGVVGTFSLWSFLPDEKHSPMGLWIYETLRDIHLRIQAIKRPELCVRGMTFGFNTELARRFGFRTDIRRGEDGSLALAMKPCGKLVFITNRKARVVTSNGTLNAEGSLLSNIRVRAIKALKSSSGLFTEKKEYEDHDNNLIK